MEYAAVIIPTLNRKKHLERCIESLKAGTLASQTDLYISVDFPPSEKYKNGYKDVLDYVKTIIGFASINVFYQESNLGPGLNRKFLEEKIADTHDKYVFTDDDNEFSPNFLEYINWGLETYKDDESIYAVCSCTDFKIKKDSNSDFFLNTSYNPYGSGHWLHKNRKCSEYLVQSSIDHIYKSKEMQNKLYTYSPMVYMWVAQDSLRRVAPMRGRNDKLTYIDIWENVYIIINNMKCVKPTRPKSRNWGLDGSGIHANINDVENYIPETKLDPMSDWIANPKRLDEYDEKINEELHRNKFSISDSERNKCEFLFSLNALFGNHFVYGVFSMLKGSYHKILNKNESTKIMYG